MLARLKWIRRSRPEQIRPDGDWRIWLILAGRGWGKSLTAAEDCIDFASFNPDSRIAFVASTSKDLRETVMEGPTGLLQRIPKGCPFTYHRSFSEIKLWNGAQINGYSAEEPDRLRGPNFHRAYADELSSWARIETWDMLNFALRIGNNPQCVITTTPKPTSLLRSIVADAKRSKNTIITKGSTYDNADNLAPGFLQYLKNKYEGTRLGRQEMEAELLDDTPGALWRRAQIDELRVREAPPMRRIVVAIDPAVSTKEGSDETGIIVAGLGYDDHGYVLADRSGKYSPDEWAREAFAQYQLWKADVIVAEVNNGGDMVESTLRVINKHVSFRSVHASRGKAIRAEPIAALYEQRRIHHLNSLPELEDQMCIFTSDYDRTKNRYSPDRVDAMVWAMNELFPLGEEPDIAGLELYSAIRL